MAELTFRVIKLFYAYSVLSLQIFWSILGFFKVSKSKISRFDVGVFWFMFCCRENLEESSFASSWPPTDGQGQSASSGHRCRLPERRNCQEKRGILNSMWKQFNQNLITWKKNCIWFLTKLFALFLNNKKYWLWKLFTLVKIKNIFIQNYSKRLNLVHLYRGF